MRFVRRRVEGWKAGLEAENGENKAKDLLSVIIDDAKQTATRVSPVVIQQTAPQSQSSSVADELAKLAKLKSDGILTDEEFQAQKSKLLG